MTALLISVLAACAGGGGESSSLDDTASCLKSSSGVSVRIDRVAEDEGKINVDWDPPSSNAATIHFERSRDDANRTEARYYDYVWADLDSGIRTPAVRKRRSRVWGAGAGI